MSFDYGLFDTLLEPLFVLAKDGLIIYANESALTLCGVTSRKAQKSKFHEVLIFSEKIEWCEKLGQIIDPTTYKEVRYSNTLGEEGRVQLTCRKFTAATPDDHWMVFVRDVTLEERLQNKYRGQLEEVERYSKNLEKMVTARTLEITRLNQQMKALLDSLRDGFLIFDAQGECLETSSKACETVLEGAPFGKKIWDVLLLPENKVSGFQKWMVTLFSEMLPFEDLSPLGPPTFPHSEGKHISLDYFPVRSLSGAIEGVVVVASDITSLVEAKRQAEIDREHAHLIIKLVKNKKEVACFIRESQMMLKDLKNHLEKPAAEWSREEVFRALHTIKGGAASFSVLKTAQASHQAEQILADGFGDKNDSAFSEKTSALKNKCAEMDLSFQEYISDTRAILGERGLSEERMIELPASEILSLSERMSAWSHGQDKAEDFLHKYMMESVGSFFEPYKELVQSVARKEEKKIQALQLINADLKIFPESYASLFASLVHAFRNSVDHGIEAPAIRSLCGKPEAGNISVSFQLIERERTLLKIQIIDDGAGIDPARIRQKLHQKGLSTSTESDQEVLQRVFDTEFSTKDVANETSGRGVGMDAILVAALKLGGTAWVDSILGHGTTLTLEVPYLKTLSISTSTKKFKAA